MDIIRDEVLSRNDVMAESKNEQEIRELKANAPNRHSEQLTNLEVDHLKQIKKINSEGDRFNKEVDKMMEEEEKEHEAKKAELVQRGNDRMMEKSNNYDAATSAALGKLDELVKNLEKETFQMEKDTIQAREKCKEIEINIEKGVFDEVEARKDKEDRLAQLNVEKLMNQQQEIQKEEEKNLIEERNLSKEQENMMIAEIKEGMRDRQQLGELTLALSQHSCDRKNRREVNARIVAVRELAQELSTFYGRAIGVLMHDPSVTIKKSQIRATITSLARYSETLGKISEKLLNIEQSLASLELSDVDKRDEFRQIKTQISSFAMVLSCLTTILKNDPTKISQEKTTEFNDMHNKLFQMINCVETIAENRENITLAIRNPQNANGASTSQTLQITEE